MNSQGSWVALAAGACMGILELLWVFFSLRKNHKRVRLEQLNENVVLSLQIHHMDQIHAHAQACYPEECCGLMLGHMTQTADQSQKRLLELYRIDNAWDQTPMPLEEDPASLSLTATQRYWIAPQDLFKAQKYARTQGWDIIGVYHSHPDHKAVPSECDRKWAWPQYSYVIVAVNSGVPHDFCSWILDDQQQFRSEQVMVLDDVASSTLETDI